MSKKSKRITSIFLSATTAVWMSGAAALMPIAAQAQTIEELQTQISDLLAMIATLQSQLVALSGGSSATCGYTFSTDLSAGDTGTDVKNLQMVLNSDTATQVAASGVGSSDNETEYFGSLTKGGVVKFQDKYASEVLTPIGLSAGTGYVGSMTRAKLNALFGTCADDDDADDDDDTATVGTGLTVSASANQPAATLFPVLSARVPFTNIDFTASSDGDITVTSLVLERTGLAVDSAFGGVVLLDEDGMQIGLSKTLNSLHQATLSEDFVVKAGQTRMMTLAGNGPSSANSRAGQVAYLSLVTVNTSAEVTGMLPITGAGHVISESLTIGTITNARGPLDPNGDADKSIGTTGYTFTGIKVTAGSQEKVIVKSIRWNQSGSASSDDIENIVTIANDVSYPTIVSSDGKYYVSTFGDGILVEKGNSVDISVKGDIIGGSARTIAFDLYKTTDLFVAGETFGYGITPPTSGTGFAPTNPWYDASIVTISNGTINITKANSVAAQNLAINLADQPLGGFNVEVKGEEISTSQIVFNVASTTGSGYGLLTNVSLYDGNGTIVAGPIDGVYSSALAQTLTFADTITFPIGENTYTLKGRVASTIGNAGTYIVSFTPSTALSNVIGQITGNTIAPTPATAVTMNTMTVKSAALTVSVSAAPVAQSVVAGVTGFTFANYVFDATQSGEDVKMTNILLAYDVVTGAVGDLTSCSLYDGSTSLNTGSNLVNPTTQSSSTTFTFDSGYTLPKGTAKTLALKCDIAGSASNSDKYRWGLDSGQQSGYTAATGLTSGQTVTETLTDSIGQLMTIASGSFVVALDSSSPSYQVAVPGGTTEVTLATLKFTASNEDIDLTSVALQLSGNASNSPLDLINGEVTLYDGATSVGTAMFITGDFATSTISGVTIPKDGSVVLTVKGNLAAIGVSEQGTQGALLKVDWDGGGGTGTKGTGASGGTAITATAGSDTASNGVRIFRAMPVFAKQSVASNMLVAGTMQLYRFSIAADGDDIGLYQLTINMATSAPSTVAGQTVVRDVKVYAYTNSSLTTPVSGFTNGQVVGTIAVPVTSGDNEAQLSSILQIPGGSTYYFKVTGEVTLTAGSGTFSGSITTKMSGDSAYTPIATAMMDQATAIDTDDTDDDLIWSPNATTTSTATHQDWTNGYYISGLPADGMSSETIAK